LTRIVPESHEFAVVEAGISAPGEMAELAAMIAPDYGIVTLVAPAHTQELGGVEGVAREKAVLLQHVRPGGLGVFPKQCWDFAAFQDLPQTSIVVAPMGAQVKAPRVINYAATFTSSGTELIVGKRQFKFRRVSRGMAQNAALAIVLASELGMMDSKIQQALENWQSAKWRGEFRRESGRLLYLDFYNANPASMEDALETFFAIAPDDEPRLLVLGCMEELGPDAALHHLQLGRSLKLRPQDRAYVIGGEATSVVAGALEAGVSRECIQSVDSLDSVAAEVAGFHGAVFVKGSRRYGLEKVLPATSTPPTAASQGGGGSGRGGLAASFALNRSVSVLPSGWHFPTKMAQRAVARSASHTPFFI
jgi:UDP-N-acetylmuramoyl-tripeptide--D-alanyl-D-alanine ligase